jgi:hypothetical protein
MIMVQHRRFTMVIGAITLGAVLLLGSPTQAGDDDRDKDKHPVKLCHRDGGHGDDRDGRGNEQTITVDAKDVPDHLNHGDHEGACNPSPHR